MSAKKKQQYITHLGVDTSALVGADWPYIASDLDGIFATCNALGVPVLIPKLVLIELDAVYLRKMREAIKDARSDLDDLARKTAGLVVGNAQWPADDQLKA